MKYLILAITMIAAQPAFAWFGSADSTHTSHGVNVGQFLQPIAPPPPQPVTTQNIQMGVINCSNDVHTWWYSRWGECSATVTFNTPFETTPHVAVWVSNLTSRNSCHRDYLFLNPRVTFVNNRQARFEMPQAQDVCGGVQRTWQLTWVAGMQVHNIEQLPIPPEPPIPPQPIEPINSPPLNDNQ